MQACYEHDIFARTHKTIFGSPITKAQADYILKRRIQQRSWFGNLSPMAYWRWWALKNVFESYWTEGGKAKIIPAQENPR